MTKVDVKCPNCGGIKVVKNGTSSKGVQRFLCQNKDCLTTTFMLEYAYNDWMSDIETRIIKMTANASEQTPVK